MADFKEILKESIVEEGANVTVDIDYIGPKKMAVSQSKKYKIKIKITGSSSADVSGNKANIIKFLTSKEDYNMSKEDVKELFPELYK